MACGRLVAGKKWRLEAKKGNFRVKNSHSLGLDITNDVVSSRKLLTIKFK